MTTDVYESWLTERGIDAPGSQPFSLMDSDLYPESSFLILASARAGDVSARDAVARLAQALRLSLGDVSWVVMDDAFKEPGLPVLRSMLPRLEIAVRLLDQDPLRIPNSSFPTEELILASRPLKIFHGPTMELMAKDGETKKKFWDELQRWLRLVRH